MKGRVVAQNQQATALVDETLQEPNLILVDFSVLRERKDDDRGAASNRVSVTSRKERSLPTEQPKLSSQRR